MSFSNSFYPSVCVCVCVCGGGGGGGGGGEERSCFGRIEHLNIVSVRNVDLHIRQTKMINIKFV